MNATFSPHIRYGLRAAGLCAALAFAAAAAPLPALNPAQSFILPPEHARDLLHQCSRVVPNHVQGTWLPGANQIRELEQRLPQALAKAMDARAADPNRSKDYAKRLPQLGRQYAGLIVGGRKVIYVNAFPYQLVDFDGVDIAADQSKAARNGHAVVICDGGDYFFGVEYDPATKSFAHFAFHGIS